MTAIPDPQMGDVWPHARPGADNANYGAMRFAPCGPFPVRSFQTFELVYTVGAYGLDDTGAIKVVQRWTGDQGPVQFDDPQAANYVTAVASNGVSLAIYAEPYPHQRPWYNGLRVTVEGGYMAPGDTITIVYGDRTGGSPGYRLQTFAERAFAFKLLVDPCATGVFLPLDTAMVEIVAGPAVSWTLVAPTLRRVGEKFSLGVRAEDDWGNATADLDALSRPLRLSASDAVDGMPDHIELQENARGHTLEGLSINAARQTTFILSDDEGVELAHSNPLLTVTEGPAAFWGDLHGQSGETVGINPMRDYLEFARDVAFLDVTSHQANDFQVTNAFWAEINRLSAEYNAPGRFVVFPGYEWSGNTPVGGDHNVFFRHEGRQIRRSSHALLTDRSDIETDAPNAQALFDALSQEDCVVYAHVGGRPADIAYADAPGLRTAVEVHSDWGTFEWIMTDAFRLGYRVGLVCNSDGHKGAPGACHPGASEFGAYSGLTCFLADSLTRDDIFSAMRSRHHYGTTGCRLHLEVRADLADGARRFSRDPNHCDDAGAPAGSARMGDIVRTRQEQMDVHVRCVAHAPIERVDVMTGAEIIATFRPFLEGDLGRRVRVIWEGARYRGRARQTHWRGNILVHGATITAMKRINAWNHERTFEQTDARTITFDAITTGNFGGCDLWLEDQAGPGDLTDARLSFESDLVSADIALETLTLDDAVFDAGGLGQRVRMFRLPDALSKTEISELCTVPLSANADTPIWVRVTTEDGHRAWSSPIYVERS
ncbi:MAG: DUF3604 domain-containing protein [Pseudomonadota bacterium]